MAGAELLVDLDSGGQSSATGPGSPIDATELEDLRWYLEDYLQTPFGVYSDRGSRIAGELAGWGRALFDSVLGTEQVRGEYADLRARGLAEIVVRSEVPERLGLPWELMRAPGASVPLVLDGIGITRCLAAKSPDDCVDAAGERLRVLMVISRPASVRDVGYQMIARPLLRSMASARCEVDLEVLRPPTLDALEARLRAARDAEAPFQVVHFDGHGVAADEGALVFERPGGGADYVTAGRLAGILTAADVPVAVLNACQSGAIGKRLETAVATGLLAGGVAAVVAMSYRVYAVAAAEFMTAFYDRLLAGDTIGEAVRAGRSRMARHPGRPSPKGELPLEDWAVPVYYRRREVRFPQLPAMSRPAPGADPDGDTLAADAEFVGRDDLFCTMETAARTDRVLVLHGPGGTGKTELARAFGRWWRDSGGVDRPGDVFWHSFGPGVASLDLDGAILETGVRLHGPAFALKDPDTRRDLVMEQLLARRLLLVWDNFELVASMPGDVTSPPGETARARLKDFLHEAAAGGRSTILVTSRTPETWLGDVRRVAVGGLLSHEAVEYADQVLAPFPVAAAQRADRSFAELLEWLDGHPLSMRLILPHLATTQPAALLAGLQGTQPLPAVDGDTAAEGNARTRSLTASVGFSIVHLSPAGRRLLVALSLLRGVADPEVLSAFSAREHVPRRFRGVSADEWDTVLDEAARLGLLTARAGGGYAIHPALPAYLAARWRSEEPGTYPDARAAADRALLGACAEASEHWGGTMTAEASNEAYAFIDRNRRTMGHMLGYALDNRQWEAAQSLFITLRQYLDRAGLHAEARSWEERALRVLEVTGVLPPPIAGLPELPPWALRENLPASSLEQILSALSPEQIREAQSAIRLWQESLQMWQDSIPALSLWSVVIGSQAARLVRAGDLDAGEALYREILRRTEPAIGSLPAARALAYDELGFVAERRGRSAEAEQMYRKALAIHEKADDRQAIARELRHLGSVAKDQGRWDEAEQRYRESLAILREEARDLLSVQLVYYELGELSRSRERLAVAEEWYAESLALAEQRHDWDGAARCLYSLGQLAGSRGQMKEAERWFRRCLTLVERVRDRPGMAAVYQELAMVALKRGQDEAEEWSRRSLAIHDELDDRLGVAGDYRMLGMIAIARRQMDEARRLFSESLTTAEDLGYQEGIIKCYQLLGALALAQERRDEAERWLRKALVSQEETGNEAGVAMACLQLGWLAEARGDAAEALELTVRGWALARQFPQYAARQAPGHVLRSVTKRLGIEAVEDCWEHVSGEPLPSDVRQLALTDQNEDEPSADR